MSIEEQIEGLIYNGFMSFPLIPEGMSERFHNRRAVALYAQLTEPFIEDYVIYRGIYSYTVEESLRYVASLIEDISAAKRVLGEDHPLLPWVADVLLPALSKVEARSGLTYRELLYGYEHCFTGEGNWELCNECFSAATYPYPIHEREQCFVYFFRGPSLKKMRWSNRRVAGFHKLAAGDCLVSDRADAGPLNYQTMVGLLNADSRFVYVHGAPDGTLPFVEAETAAQYTRAITHRANNFSPDGSAPEGELRVIPKGPHGQGTTALFYWGSFGACVDVAYLPSEDLPPCVASGASVPDFYASVALDMVTVVRDMEVIGQRIGQEYYPLSNVLPHTSHTFSGNAARLFRKFIGFSSARNTLVYRHELPVNCYDSFSETTLDIGGPLLLYPLRELPEGVSPIGSGRANIASVFDIPSPYTWTSSTSMSNGIRRASTSTWVNRRERLDENTVGKTRVLSYHHSNRPRVLKHTSSRSRQPMSQYMIGFEVEKNSITNRDGSTAYDEGYYVDNTPLFAYWERDGSCGLEGVTHVYGLSRKKKFFEDVDASAHLVNAPAENRNEDSRRYNCGGHISISGPRVTLGNIRKYCGLIYALYKKRLLNRFCYENKDLYESRDSHYCVVRRRENIRNCVEFRLIPRVINVSQLKWRFMLFYKIAEALHNDWSFEELLTRVTPLLRERYDTEEKLQNLLTFADHFNKYLTQGVIHNDITVYIENNF